MGLILSNIKWYFSIVVLIIISKKYGFSEEGKCKRNNRKLHPESTSRIEEPTKHAIREPDPGTDGHLSTEKIITQRGQN